MKEFICRLRDYNGAILDGEIMFAKIKRKPS